ncbi:hypothetical protein AVEN_190322-1 [Araneus ventricosus]|uniref:Uncharacterized protein n=1 Tax=Araneus ventricosus TaxID=182803 RepID=A0A4Y2GUG2_ARAVE|nr:hypothetical protein AVEN_190322-1 [Araneus ventricosus]
MIFYSVDDAVFPSSVGYSATAPYYFQFSHSSLANVVRINIKQNSTAQCTAQTHGTHITKACTTCNRQRETDVKAVEGGGDWRVEALPSLSRQYISLCEKPVTSQKTMGKSVLTHNTSQFFAFFS